MKASLPKLRLAPAIEHLEARIAPAVTVNFSADHKTATWLDSDGDLVTLKANKAIFNPNDPTQFTFLQNQPTDLGGQLALLDLRTIPGSSNGLDLTFTAKRNTTTHLGDGTVHVGRIDATGFDLGTVNISGDLGSISAGDGNTATAAIKSLTVASAGFFGTSTQGAQLGGQNTTLDWQFTGAIGSLTIKGDCYAAIDAQDNVAAFTVNPIVGIGSVNIWGDLVGGDASQTGYTNVGSGYLFTEGKIGTVKIGGDILPGSSPYGGSVRNTGGAVTSISVGGSLYGGAADSTGIISSGPIGKLSLGGSLYGAGGKSSGSITAPTITSVSLGSLFGGSQPDAGSIVATTLGTVNLRGSLTGGSASFAGSIVASTVTSVTVGQSVLGGSADDTGVIYGSLSLGKVTIGGSLVGGSSPRDVNGVVQLITRTGAIGSDHKIGSVTVQQNVVPGVADFSGVIFTSLFQQGDIGSVTIGGTLGGFSNFDAGDGSGMFPINGIYSDGRLGPVKVGAIQGTGPQQPAQIVALGKANPANASEALAIASVTVARGAYGVQILAGYSRNTAATSSEVVVNPDVQIGAVKIGNAFIGSSIAAGIVGLDHGFGDPVNSLVGGVPGFGDNSSIPARIASVTVGSFILGNPQNTANFFTGIVAQQIGAVKIGGTALELTPNTPGHNLDVFEIGLSPNFFIREVA